MGEGPSPLTGECGVKRKKSTLTLTECLACPLSCTLVTLVFIPLFAPSPSVPSDLGDLGDLGGDRGELFGSHSGSAASARALLRVERSGQSEESSPSHQLVHASVDSFNPTTLIAVYLRTYAVYLPTGSPPSQKTPLRELQTTPPTFTPPPVTLRFAPGAKLNVRPRKLLFVPAPRSGESEDAGHRDPPGAGPVPDHWVKRGRNARTIGVGFLEATDRGGRSTESSNNANKLCSTQIRMGFLEAPNSPPPVE